MMRGKLPRSYVMRGRATPAPKTTIEDAPDRRVPRPPTRALSPEEVKTLVRPGAIDARLRPTDRWLERWGATHGGGSILPGIANVELIARTAPAGVPMLDDRESLLIDEVVDTSPGWARTFAVLWYRTPCTVQEIADVLRIRWRQAVYEERRMILAYYLGRFVEIGLCVTFWEQLP